MPAIADIAIDFDESNGHVKTVAKGDKRAGWGTVAAVSNGGVLAVNDDIASRWGPRIVEFVGIVAAEIKRIAAK